jgi:hypothetical protein
MRLGEALGLRISDFILGLSAPLLSAFLCA